MLMFKLLSELLHNVSRWWLFLLSFIIFLLFIWLVLPLQSAKFEADYGDIGSPDLSFYYSSDDLYRMAEAYGEEGRQSYVKARYTFDLLWPVVYSFFLITGISWLTRRAFAPGSLWLRSNLVPILGALCDYLENVSTTIIMVRYPTQTGVVDEMATVFTMAKWVFVNLSFLLLLIAMVGVIRAWLKS